MSYTDYALILRKGTEADFKCLLCNTEGWDGRGDMKKKRLFRAGLFLAACLILGAAAGLLYYTRHHISRWTITQYGTDSGRQMMFYCIENNLGQLALIDGGWDTDAEEVRNVIMAHGGHVDAWIITHPHPDHTGAFNVIMAGNTDGSVVVEKIYSTDVNRARYQETAHDYDGIEAYETFWLLTKDADNVVFLKENDSFDLIGLSCEVLHGWDEHVDELPDHLCNDGSLMFRAEGRKESMLFCGDVQKEMEEYIIPAHGEQLKADYVQAGHHGNWGLSTGFYEYVKARGAFLDGPASILDDENGIYDGHELVSWFEEQGTELFLLDEAPNTIELR